MSTTRKKNRVGLKSGKVRGKLYASEKSQQILRVVLLMEEGGPKEQREDKQKGAERENKIPSADNSLRIYSNAENGMQFLLFLREVKLFLW